MERKSYLDYAGWLSGQGKAGTTYTLCARLDNLFRSGYGYGILTSFYSNQIIRGRQPGRFSTWLFF